MPVSRTRLVVAVVLCVLLAGLTFAGATWGLRAVVASSPSEQSAPGAMPEIVYNATDTVPTTSSYGPVGAVSMVFAGTDVLTGLSDEMRNPWIAISAHSGDYRALDVPHRPEPGPQPVSVSPDGRTLAWAWSGGVVIYDAVDDVARELTTGIGGSPSVGEFSPDGDRLLVYDGELHVLDVGSGTVSATETDVPVESARHAVWTPDGRTITHVADRELVSYDWQAADRSAAPVALPDSSTLAWQPSGEQLAAMHRVRGVNMLEVFDVTAGGEPTRSTSVRPRQFAVQRLLGFTSDSHLSVGALSLETGSIERVYRVSVADSTVTPVMQLAGPGINWVGAQTVTIADQPLARGSAAYEEPRWPWSDGAKLLASVVFALFVLGLYLTRRRPRRIRRA